MSILFNDSPLVGMHNSRHACGAASSFASLLAAHVVDYVYFHAALLKYQLHDISQPTSKIKPVEKQNSPAVDTTENMG